jgi:hypothetical protein
MKFKTIIMVSKADMHYIHEDLENLTIEEDFQEDGIEVETTNFSLIFTTKGKPIDFIIYENMDIIQVHDWDLPILWTDVQGIIIVPIVE